MTTSADLSLRLRAILSEFGVEALRGDDVDGLLQRAAELCAEGRGAQFRKALEYLRGEDMLLVRAGIGWAPDAIGKAAGRPGRAFPRGAPARARAGADTGIIAAWNEIRVDSDAQTGQMWQ